MTMISTETIFATKNMRRFFNNVAVSLFIFSVSVGEVNAFHGVVNVRLSPTRIDSALTILAETSSSENLEGNDRKDQEDFSFQNEREAGNVLSDDEISKSLSRKIRELKFGIGKRYIIRTQRGFLNVHYEPTDPYMTENVVNQLADGDIVTATGPTRGIWIPHDGGGWSVSKFGGFTWLEPIDE